MHNWYRFLTQGGTLIALVVALVFSKGALLEALVAFLVVRIALSLADESINMLMISTSEIKISVVVAEKYLELAVRSLHTSFGLDAED